ncbi:MAG: carboxypeptidase-like regulatory domain-containing protein [Bryobacteraceae bacterium]
MAVLGLVEGSVEEEDQMKLIIGIVAVLISVSVCLSQQIPIEATRFVTGVLTGDDGTPIVGAIVSLHRAQSNPSGRPRKTEWFAISGQRGAFRFDDVYEGQYSLCAQAPGGPWLDPCEWDLKPTMALLSDAQRSVAVTMIMKMGAVVPIRIDDAGRLLSAHEGKTPGAHLLLAVSNDPLIFHPALLISRDATGSNHQIVVPFDTPVKLVAFSSFFRLTDGAGLELAKAEATKIAITVPSTKKPDTIRLVVTGTNR